MVIVVEGALSRIAAYLCSSHAVLTLRRKIQEIWNSGYCGFYLFCWPASLYNLFQMKQARFTLLLSIFISTSVHVSGNYVPIIRRTYCIYATLVFFTLYGRRSGLLSRPDSHPDDGCGWHPKHVEWNCRTINRLLFVASRWTIINILNSCSPLNFFVIICLFFCIDVKRCQPKGRA